MVTDNHYRWDFVGLSTDQIPTPATSEKVVNGSTFYCSDTSKLYVFCKDTWYERKPLGSGGGGGTTYTAGTGIDITEDTISIDEEVVATLEELNARIVQGEGAPTTSTEGVVGGLYEDTTNGKLYICTAITAGTDPDPDTYTWEEVGGGGGGVTPVQTTGTSTSDVMSQNATSSMVFQDPATNNLFSVGNVAQADSGASNIFWAYPYSSSENPYNNSINIFGQCGGNTAISLGTNAITRIDNQISIGNSPLNNYSSTSGIAIGQSAQCLNAYSVAIGKSAKTSRAGEFNIGAGTSGDGYNSTNYRVLGGVHDGQDAHDAVNVDQVNGVIDAINTALSTNIPHIGAAS